MRLSLPAAAAAAAIQLRESEIPDDAFTTEKMEEAAIVMGPQSSITTAWRTQEHLQELSYTQLW